MAAPLPSDEHYSDHPVAARLRREAWVKIGTIAFTIVAAFMTGVFFT